MNVVQLAPFAIKPSLSATQQAVLVDQAITLTNPPGPIVGRSIRSPEGHTVEVLCGWEKLEAFISSDAFPNAREIPIGLIDCNDAEAAFYAIEFASKEHHASGYATSPLLYAAASQKALELFENKGRPWSIKELADALCIARPTLSNRLRLLKGLAPVVKEALADGSLKPEFAKILLAEKSFERQSHFTKLVRRGKLTTRSLYKLVHPNYKAPLSIASKAAKKPDDANHRYLERSLSERFGTKASVERRGEAVSVNLTFFDLHTLKGLVEQLEEKTAHNAQLAGRITLEAATPQATDALLGDIFDPDD